MSVWCVRLGNHNGEQGEISTQWTCFHNANNILYTYAEKLHKMGKLLPNHSTVHIIPWLFWQLNLPWSYITGEWSPCSSVVLTQRMNETVKTWWETTEPAISCTKSQQEGVVPLTIENQLNHQYTSSLSLEKLQLKLKISILTSFNYAVIWQRVRNIMNHNNA